MGEFTEWLIHDDQKELYRLVNSALAILSFAVFSVWPAAGSAMYGWLFGIFERVQVFW